MGVGSEIGVNLATPGARDLRPDCIVQSGLTDRQKCGFSRFLSALCRSHRFRNLQVINPQFFIHLFT